MVVPRIALQVGQRLADRVFGDHVQTDGRLVEEDHLGVVQQRGHQLAPHPLAQAELADGDRQQVGHAQPLAQVGQVGAVAGGAGAIDVMQQVEALPERQIPPELVRWPNTTPIRLASATRSRNGSSPATRT